jgi:hypothetical protein
LSAWSADSESTPMTSNPFTADSRTSGLLSEFSAWIKA